MIVECINALDVEAYSQVWRWGWRAKFTEQQAMISIDVEVCHRELFTCPSCGTSFLITVFPLIGRQKLALFISSSDGHFLRHRVGWWPRTGRSHRLIYHGREVSEDFDDQYYQLEKRLELYSGEQMSCPLPAAPEPLVLPIDEVLRECYGRLDMAAAIHPHTILENVLTLEPPDAEAFLVKLLGELSSQNQLKLFELLLTDRYFVRAKPLLSRYFSAEIDKIRDLRSSGPIMLLIAGAAAVFFATMIYAMRHWELGWKLPDALLYLIFIPVAIIFVSCLFGGISSLSECPAHIERLRKYQCKIEGKKD